MSGPVEKHLKLAEETLDLVLCNAHEFEDVREVSIRDIAEALAKVERESLERGYLGGFAASGEGWNGEYPFEGRNPLDNKHWLRVRDQFIAVITSSPDDQGEAA